MTVKPIRALTASTLVNTCGDGLYIAASALFFTRGLGPPVSEVGIGLTCAGVLGLSAGVLLGRIVDRRGPKQVLIDIQLVQAAALGSYVLVGRSFPAFVVVATVVIASMQGADASQGALVAELGGVDPVRLRAYLHSVSNVGISAGLKSQLGLTVSFQVRKVRVRTLQDEVLDGSPLVDLRGGGDFRRDPSGDSPGLVCLRRNLRVVGDDGAVVVVHGR